MEKSLPSIVWIYAAGVVLWFASNSWLGDAARWLALVTAFAPCFFLPLILLVPAGVVIR
jgi:hypothetical protein